MGVPYKAKEIRLFLTGLEVPVAIEELSAVEDILWTKRSMNRLARMEDWRYQTVGDKDPQLKHRLKSLSDPAYGFRGRWQPL